MGLIVNNGEGVKHGPFKAFSELDPYIKYSLIGIMIIFLGLMFISCYLCIARKAKRNKEGDGDVEGDNNTNTKMDTMHRVASLTKSDDESNKDDKEQSMDNNDGDDVGVKD